MLVSHYAHVFNQVWLYYINGRVMLDCALPAECNRIVKAFREGDIWFKDNRFGINHTAWMENLDGIPIARVMFSAQVPMHFIVEDLCKEFVDIEPEEELLRYDLGNDGMVVRGAFPALHIAYLDTFRGKNRLEDTDPTDPEELEVEQDVKKKYVHPEEQKLTMGDLFKRSMDVAKAYSEKLDEVYGDEANKVRKVLCNAKRYEAMMQVDTGNFDEHRFGQKTSRNHIRWMIQELHDNLEQTLTKKHRWLGFIQGMIIAYGYSTVDREREQTRELFHGD